MVWFRVDDGWHKHRKRIRAGLDLEGMAAQGLWCAAGSWASDELTDGFVPDDIVDYLAPGVGQNLAKRLERAKLWIRAERDGEEGWQFWQWDQQQPTAEEVTAALSRKSTGGKLGNHRRWHVGEGKTDPRCPYCHETAGQDDTRPDHRISDRYTDRRSESHANPTDPTRPDPTRVLPSEVLEEGTSSASPPDDPPTKKITGKRGTRLPAGFQATPEMIEWARSNTPNVGLAETEAFIDHFTAAPGQKGIKTDWVATWRNWMRREQKHITEQRQRRGPASPAGSGAQNRGPIPADERCPTHRGQRKTTCGPCRSERHGRPKEVA